MTEIIRGNAAVLKALTDNRSRLVRQHWWGDDFAAPGLTSAQWLDLLGSLLVSMETFGFTEEVFATLGVTRHAGFHPALVLSDTEYELVIELQSPDRGFIPTLGMDISLSHVNNRRILSRQSLLEDAGFLVVPQGRNDKVIPFVEEDFAAFLKGHSQVARQFKKSLLAGYTTARITPDEFVGILDSVEGRRIMAENAGYHMVGLMTALHFIEGMPAMSPELEALKAADYAMAEGYDDSMVRHLNLTPNHTHYAHRLNGELMGVSYCYTDPATEQVWWTNSHLRRSGPSVVAREKFGMLAAGILGMIEDVYATSQSFNLGIDLFPYKEQFKPINSFSLGLAST